MGGGGVYINFFIKLSWVVMCIKFANFWSVGCVEEGEVGSLVRIDRQNDHDSY